MHSFSYTRICDSQLQATRGAPFLRDLCWDPNHPSLGSQGNDFLIQINLLANQTVFFFPSFAWSFHGTPKMTYPWQFCGGYHGLTGNQEQISVPGSPTGGQRQISGDALRGDVQPRGWIFQKHIVEQMQDLKVFHSFSYPEAFHGSSKMRSRRDHQTIALFNH